MFTRIIGLTLLMVLLLSISIAVVRAVAPNGDVLAYELHDPYFAGQVDVVVLDLNTGIKVLNMGMFRQAFEPRWLPCDEPNCVPRLSYLTVDLANNLAYLMIHDLLTGETINREHVDNGWGYDWSPCGLQGCAHWLAYVDVVDGNQELYIDDGTNATRITFSPEQETSPVWLPCTETPCVPRISFWRSRQSDIFVRNLITDEEINITNEPFGDSQGTWLLNGDFIWPSQMGGSRHLYRLHGRAEIPLTQDRHEQFNPTASRSGLLAYEVRLRENNQSFFVYLRHPDGRTIPLAENAMRPAFMP